jgi:hypothetical protein
VSGRDNGLIRSTVTSTNRSMSSSLPCSGSISCSLLHRVRFPQRDLDAESRLGFGQCAAQWIALEELVDDVPALNEAYRELRAETWCAMCALTSVAS